MTKTKSPKKILPIVLIAVLLAVTAAVIGAVIYYYDHYYPADMDAVNAFTAEKAVKETVLEDGSIVFGTGKEEAGFVFYPGAGVEHKAYIPLMRAVAENGVFCVLVKMPLGYAFLNGDAAEGVRQSYPCIDRWYVGGHSLGGAIAASFIESHSDSFSGLVLLAAYSSSDLKDNVIKVLSVYGSEDGILNMQTYAEERVNLPDSTREEVIRGGCHSYFAMYGLQKGDGTPTISNTDQINTTAAFISDFING